MQKFYTDYPNRLSFTGEDWIGIEGKFRFAHRTLGYKQISRHSTRRLYDTVQGGYMIQGTTVIDTVFRKRKDMDDVRRHKHHPQFHSHQVN